MLYLIVQSSSLDVLGDNGVVDVDDDEVSSLTERHLSNRIFIFDDTNFVCSNFLAYMLPCCKLLYPVIWFNDIPLHSDEIEEEEERDELKVIFLDLARRFWNQVLICFSLNLTSLEIRFLSSEEIYLFCKKIDSSISTCLPVNLICPPFRGFATSNILRRTISLWIASKFLGVICSCANVIGDNDDGIDDVMLLQAFSLGIVNDGCPTEKANGE